MPNAPAATHALKVLRLLARHAAPLEQRDEAQKTLQAAGVGTGIHYPVPVHLQKAYAGLGYGAGDFPVTELLANQFLSVPIYAELAPQQVSEVVTELEKIFLAEVA